MPPQKAQAAPDFIPADGTPDFIPADEQVSRVPPPQPAAIQAAPQEGLGGWLEQLGQDIRTGGGRTLPGRVLGVMQGRGEKGYSGLEAGTSPGVASYMGSPILGAIQTAKGATEYWGGHPLTGAAHALGGELQMATIPSSFIAPEAAGTGQEIPTVLGLPTRAHAARILGEIGEAAKDVPVSMETTQPAIEQFRQFVATGGKPSPVAGKLAARVSPVGPRQEAIAAAKGPVMFPEARQFYSNISQASAKPGFLRQAIESPMMPKLRRELGGMREALGQDIQQAAQTVGRGEDYAKAMQEYAKASELAKWLKRAGVAAGTAGTEEILRQTGILGKIVPRMGIGQ